MALVLAIEPDHRQAAILTRVIHERVHAELMLVDSRDAAIAALSARVPDVILLTALLSPRDEDEMVAHLRTLAGAEHVQTHTIPQLASPNSGSAAPSFTGGLLGKFRRKKEVEPIAGCDPTLFADEVRAFLARAAELKAHSAPVLVTRAPEHGAVPGMPSRAAVVEYIGTGDDETAAAGERPDPASAWSSPFEWRRAEPAETATSAAVARTSPQPARSPLVSAAPLAVIAEEEEQRREEQARIAQARGKDQAAREEIAARERVRLEAEAAAKAEKLRLDAAAAAERERVRLEAEATARRQAEAAQKEKLRLEAEAAAKAEKLRLEAEAAAGRERVRLEAAATAARQAEAAQKEKLRLEAEAAAKAEKLRVDAAAAAERQRVRLEAEAAARRQAEAAQKEKLRLEAEAAAKAQKLRLEAEAAAERERVRLEAEAAARRQAEAAKKEKLRLEAEAAAKAEKLRLAAEAAAKTEELRLEAEAAAERERMRLDAEAAMWERARAARERHAEETAAASAADGFADFRLGADEATHALFKLMPIAVWARREEVAPVTFGLAGPPDTAAQSADSTPADDLRELMAGLCLPPHVAAVSYPRGCRIRRVRVPASAAPRLPGGTPLIVSKRALDQLRG